MDLAFGWDFGRALLWIVLLPLFGALINGISGRWASRSLVRAIAVGSVALSFVLAVACFLKLVATSGHGGEHPAPIVNVVYDWFSVSVNGAVIPVRVALLMDHLSGVMTLVITGIGLLIHLYASSYMEDDPSYARFFTYLNLFTGSMLILVLASNMPLMFVGWEGVGLCSYLLIGFWWETPAYAAAGKKAFIVNRIGDFGVLLGMLLLVATTMSFEFGQINENASMLAVPLRLDATHSIAWITTATAACLFLFLGCAGKSAQLPLYVWLPDAMAGPTPVSALIHAATMVTAGVYLVVRLSHVFLMSPTAMAVIAIVGACTALFAASIALVQNQMKKILAYSTVSQLGFMFAGVGVGAFGGGFFHVFTHAFFKACLFLGAGSVMHAVHAHGDADLRELGGMKKFMPITRWTFLLSCFAIAGFPLTSGFFSKDDILLGAAYMGTGPWADYPRWVGWTVFGMLAVAAFMTAFYMFRLYILAFEGEYRGGPKHGDGHDTHGEEAHAHAHADPHESPWAITVPLAVLAAGAMLVGFLGMPHWLGFTNVWEHWLAPSIAELPVTEGAHVTLGIGATAMTVGTLVGLGGIGLAYFWYVMQPGTTPKRIAEAMPRFHALLMDKWRVDELYAFLFIRPMAWLARFAANFDKLLVDGLLAKATSSLTLLGGWVVTRAQTGVVYTYSAVMVVGLASVAWWYLVPHAGLEYAVQGPRVKLQAASGLGYEYRFDVNSDGQFETEWSRERALDGAYEPKDFVGGAIVLDTQRPGRRERELRLHGGDFMAFDVTDLGAEWQAPPRVDEAGRAVPLDDTPPAVRWSLPARDIFLPFEPRGGASHETTLQLARTLAESIQGGESAISVARANLTTEEGRRLLGYLEGEDGIDGRVRLADGSEARFEDGARAALVETPAGVHVVGLDDAGLLLRPNGARARARGADVTSEILLRPGEVAQVGLAIVRVAAVVRSTVEVRNAFGYTVSESADIIVRPEPPAPEVHLPPPGGAP
jgi:NADH-quinone oxidoreductase subunit L